MASRTPPPSAIWKIIQEVRRYVTRKSRTSTFHLRASCDRLGRQADEAEVRAGRDGKRRVTRRGRRGKLDAELFELQTESRWESLSLIEEARRFARSERYRKLGASTNVCRECMREKERGEVNGKSCDAALPNIRFVIRRNLRKSRVANVRAGPCRGIGYPFAFVAGVFQRERSSDVSWNFNSSRSFFAISVISILHSKLWKSEIFQIFRELHF